MSKVQTQPCVRFKDNVHASLSTFISQAYVLVHVWLHSTHATAPTVMALPTSLKILHTHKAILHLRFLSNLVKQTFSSFRVPVLKDYWMSIVHNTHRSILHQACSILNQIYLTRLTNILWNVWEGQEGDWKSWPHFFENTVMTSLDLCLSLQLQARTAYNLCREYHSHLPSGTGHALTHVGGENTCGYQKHESLWSYSSVVAMLPLLPWLQTNWNCCLFSV